MAAKLSLCFSKTSKISGVWAYTTPGKETV